MNFGQVMDANSKSAGKKRVEKPTLRELDYKKSANGGHVFTHRMDNHGPEYHEPEVHTFGPEEGHKALAHFAEHAGLSEHMGEPAGDEDSAAGAAT